MALLRTFIAVSLSDLARQALARLIQDLSGLTRGVRLVSAENIHLTLKFMGEVEAARLPDLKRALELSVVGIQPFSYELCEKGCFPNWQRPRVFWIGVQDLQQALLRLQRQLESEFANFGFPAESRSFQPHLTIGRVKDPRNLSPFLAKFREDDFGSYQVQVTQVRLIQSDLLPTGARYTPLHTVALKT